MMRATLGLVVLTSMTFPTAVADPIAVHPSEDANASLVAISATGNATCDGGGQGDPCVSASGIGNATCASAFTPGDLDTSANAHCASLSGTGDATCEGGNLLWDQAACVAVSATGDATCSKLCVAVSATGHASGSLAWSVCDELAARGRPEACA